MSQVNIDDVFTEHQQMQKRDEYFRELSTDSTTKLQRSDSLYACLELVCSNALRSPGALAILKHGIHPTELTEESRKAMNISFVSWGCADAIYFNARQEHLRARGDKDDSGRIIPSLYHVRSPERISEVLHKTFNRELQSKLHVLKEEGRFERHNYQGKPGSYGLWRLGYPRILTEADFVLMVDTDKVSLKSLIYGTMDRYRETHFDGFKLTPRLFFGAVRLGEAIFALHEYLNTEYPGLKPNMQAVVETLVHIVLKMSLTRMQDNALRSNLVLLANRLAIGGEESMDVVLQKLMIPRLHLGRDESFPLVERLSTLAYATQKELDSTLKRCMDLLHYEHDEVSLQDKLLDGVQSLGPNPKRVDSYSVDAAREARQFAKRVDNRLFMRAAGK